MVLGGRITLIAYAAIGLTLVVSSSAVEHGAHTVRSWRRLRHPAAPSIHEHLRPDVGGPSCELPPCEPVAVPVERS